MDPFYQNRAPFLKHLHNLAISGFYTRELDADDFEFLERVKVSGIANGSLPKTGVVLLEELEFWHLPYTIAPGIERRIGKRPRSEESPEQRQLREARARAREARRMIREYQQSIADAEMERERHEYQAAIERRKMREAMRDAEWEAAAPARAHFGATINRHHVPEWKLEEQRNREATRLKAAKLEKIVPELNQPKFYAEWEQPKSYADWERFKEERKRERFKQLLSRSRARREAKQRRKADEEAMELAHRQAMILEAQRDVQHATELERQHQAGPDIRTADELKQAIITLFNSMPSLWDRTFDTAMRALGCTDAAFMDRCIRELLREGKLRIGP